MNPDEEIEEYEKVTKDKIYCWKSLRILARNDLQPFVPLIKNGTKI
jgi:hypothetical protein